MKNQESQGLIALCVLVVVIILAGYFMMSHANGSRASYTPPINAPVSHPRDVH